MTDARRPQEETCSVCGFTGLEATYTPHDCYWVLRERKLAKTVADLESRVEKLEGKVSPPDDRSPYDLNRGVIIGRGGKVSIR